MGLRCHICGERADMLQRWNKTPTRHIWVCKRCYNLILRESRKGPICPIESA